MSRTVSFAAGWLLLLALSLGARAEGSGAAPDFREVYDLVRAHLPGLSEGDLEHAAVQGFVSKLGPKVSLINPKAGPGAGTNQSPVSKASCLAEGIAYVRVTRVEGGLDKAVREACATLGATNRLAGLVLDLRYAGGTDYAAAADTAGLFLKAERPLLDWGQGMAQSKETADALSLPVAVLVNRETAGAAEALAGAVRQTGSGLIFGGQTAGQAMIAQDFPLKDGQVLRIATAPIRLGDGTSLPADGLKPDIAVEVKPEAERAYYADAFQTAPAASGTGTNAVAGAGSATGASRPVRRTRFNEAELVRQRKEGLVPDQEGTTDRAAAREEQPTVQDPALARALDVLKGLAVVRHSRS